MPARAENVAVVRHMLGALGDLGALDDQTLADVRLAVTEACANVVVHAYPHREDGPLQVEVDIAEDQLAVTVRDEGSGMEEPGESRGLGLALMSALAETMHVTHDEHGHTAVHMTFALPGAAGPLA